MANNIFKNINTKVEKFSINPGMPKTGTDICAARVKLDSIRKAEKSAHIASVMEQVERDKHMSELNGCVINGQITRTRVTNAVNNITDTAKEMLLVNVIEDIFKKALLIDEDFIAQKESTIHHIIESHIHNNGGFAYLESAIARTDSALLREIKDICTETAKKITKRKLKNIKEENDPDLIRFDMTSDEEEEFENDKSKLSPDEIAKLVKDKVFTVIRDEKERQADEDKLVADIEAELKTSDDVEDEKSAKEAVNRILTGKAPMEEATLFNAIFRNCYHEYLTENIAGAQYAVQNDDERTEKYNELGDMDEDEAATGSADPDDTSTSNDLSKSVDMDLVLAEAIASYTLMETMYTLQLENYSYQNIRALTNKLIHPVREGKDEETPEREAFKKHRKKFFKYFNEIKDLDDVDENKEKIEELKDEIASDEMEYFEGNVKKAIAQIEEIIDKNEDRKDDYEPILDWLKELLNNDTKSSDESDND